MTGDSSALEIDIAFFDCDGVILDTNQAKIAAFEATARSLDVPDATASQFSSWQARNFGTSRYALFAKLIHGDFGAVPSALTVSELLEDYAARARRLYESAPLCDGALDLVESMRGIPLYVASGSDESELRNEFQRRRLDGYFVGVHGSPKPKSHILGDLLSSHRSLAEPTNSVIMIGDALADLAAANDNGIEFYFVERYSAAPETVLNNEHGIKFETVRDLNELVGAFRSRLNTGVGRIRI